MSDFDNNTQQNLPGFEDWPELKHNLLPDFNQVLAKRLAPTQQELPGFDPHALMVKKHKVETGEVPPDPTPEVKWPEKDVKALEDFCQQHGIMGYNCGRMHPIAALAMLKQQLGYDDRPLQERVPFGYEKAGTPNKYGPSFPYAQPADKRVIISG